MNNSLSKLTGAFLKLYKYPNNFTNFNPAAQVSDANAEKNAIRAIGKALEKQHLTIITTQNSPLNYAVMENGEWVGKGAAFDFIRYVQDHYKFSYSVSVHNDQELGNNSSGIFGRLGKGEADIAAVFLPILPESVSYFDYSPPLDMGEWRVLMRRPSESATGSGLLAPFTTDVWVMIMISLICMGPIVSLLTFWHKRLCPGDQTVSHGILDCVWFVYGAIVKQGSTLCPTADSTRLLFAVWWIFITILTAFYTANLTAFLTLSIFTLPVAQPEDIGAKRYSWVTDRGNVIQKAMNDVLQTPMKNSIPYYMANSTSGEILDDYVLNKNYLYINDRLILEDLLYADYMSRARRNLQESERCVFVITTWSVITYERAFGFRKNFPFKPIFDKLLLQMVEGGVVKFKVQEHLPKVSICPLNLKSIDRQLRNTDFLLTYYIISGGFGSSVLSFLMECLIGLYYKLRGRRNTKTEEDDFPNMPPHPPAYHTLFKEPFNYPFGEKENNGRNYWVVPSKRGRDIIPMRTPSTVMFQYTH